MVWGQFGGRTAWRGRPRQGSPMQLRRCAGGRGPAAAAERSFLSSTAWVSGSPGCGSSLPGRAGLPSGLRLKTRRPWENLSGANLDEVFSELGLEGLI